MVEKYIFLDIFTKILADQIKQPRKHGPDHQERPLDNKVVGPWR